MAWLFVGLIAALFVQPSLQQAEFVDIVRQNFKERISFQLEQQIKAYVRQEVTYKAYASYFERADVGLPGLKGFFSSRAKTARKSAFELTELANQRGGHVLFPVIRLKDGCKSIKDELVKGQITKATDVMFSPARQEPLICHFLLLEKKEAPQKQTDKRPRKPSKDKNKPKKKRSKTKRSTGWWPNLRWGAQNGAQNQMQADASAPMKPDRGEWEDGLMGLEDAVAIEKTVQQDLLFILKMARRGDNRDPQEKEKSRGNDEYINSA
ncbi:ferritin [Elysia marginata]|uniref:Ferritin n=1 Tax=Elysia marginata TaxID=1093978 RepID=A0AAV4J6I0_9GAST|nr:ferritin [Elysia marginata]